VTSLLALGRRWRDAALRPSASKGRSSIGAVNSRRREADEGSARPGEAVARISAQCTQALASDYDKVSQWQLPLPESFTVPPAAMNDQL
jgi:hypothetical protein